MWMAACVVWQFEFDRSAGEHHERKGGFGAVEAVGASDEQPDLGVEAFVTPVGQDRRVRLMPVVGSIPLGCW